VLQGGLVLAKSGRLEVGISYLLELLQLIVQILDTAFLSHLLGGLEATYDVHLRLIGKRAVDFL